MLAKRFSTVFFCVFLLFCAVKPVFSGNRVSEALADALRSRKLLSVEEVSQKFFVAIEQTSNPAQKISILSLLADFLIDNHEWERAVGVYEIVMQQGSDFDKPWAMYGAAQAFAMLNRPDDARGLCARLSAEFPGSSMEAFAKDMKKSFPGSIHGRMADFFPEKSPGASASTGKTEEVPLQADIVEGEEQPVSVNEAKSGNDDEKKPDLAKVIRITAWNNDLEGQIEARGMDLDLENAAGFDRKTRLLLNAEWQFSRRNLARLEYSLLDHHGFSTKAVIFDNLMYSPGSKVKIRTNSFDLGIAHSLHATNNNPWAFLYGVRFSSTRFRLEQQMLSGLRAGELNQELHLPYIGVESAARVSDNIRINGMMKFFPLFLGNSDNKLFDFNVALLFGGNHNRKTSETEWFGTLGYRLFMLRGKTGNDSIELGYSGPTFGLESHF